MSKELSIKVTDKNYDFLKRIALEDCRKLNDLISLIFIRGLDHYWGENSISIKKEDYDYTQEEKKQIIKNEQIEKELTKQGKVLHELPICDRRKLGHKNVQEWFYCGGYDADENNLANVISKQMMKDLLETLNQEVN